MILFYRCSGICNYGDMKGIFNIIKFKYSKKIYIKYNLKNYINKVESILNQSLKQMKTNNIV